MLKEKIIEVRCCDYCEAEEDTSVLNKCGICGKDFCQNHSAYIETHENRILICYNCLSDSVKNYISGLESKKLNDDNH